MALFLAKGEGCSFVVLETIPQHAALPSIPSTSFSEAAFVASYQTCWQEFPFVGLTWLATISYQLEGLPCVIPSPQNPQSFLWTVNPGLICKFKFYWLIEQYTTSESWPLANYLRAADYFYTISIPTEAVCIIIIICGEAS